MSNGPYIPIPESEGNDPWKHPRDDDVIPVADDAGKVLFRIILPFEQGTFTRDTRVFNGVPMVGTIGLAPSDDVRRTLAQLWWYEVFKGYVLTLHLPEEDGPSTNLRVLGPDIFLECRERYMKLSGPVVEWMKRICEQDMQDGKTVFSPPSWAK